MLKFQKHTFFLLLLVPLAAFPQLEIPEGYTLVKESPANGKPMEQVFLDFDEDLVEDIALFVEDTSKFSSYKFLLYLSSQQKTYAVDLINLKEESVYPVQLKLKNNVIELGYFEDGSTNFSRRIKLRFDSRNNKIQVIGYDVSYKSSPTRYIDKSYNLLTGKYIVKRSTYDGAKKASIEEYLGENDFFKNAVFIENLDEAMITYLDDVGSSYE